MYIYTYVYMYVYVYINMQQDNKLVRISKLPGCTKSVNYFAFIKGKNTHVTYMVDLPGYGFAKTSKTEKEKWQVSTLYACT
jgi:GTP-binding protein